MDGGRGAAVYLADAGAARQAARTAAVREFISFFNR